MEVSQIVVLLTPVVVWLVTQLAKFLFNVSGKWIPIIIVPVLSIAITLLAGFIPSVDTNFWVQVGFGLLAVFMNELIVQLKKPKPIE